MVILVTLVWRALRWSFRGIYHTTLSHTTFLQVYVLYSYVAGFLIVPCAGLFVVVSWISFVVPPDVIPGRMALLVTLFLVLVNIFNTVTTNTPKAEGMLS